MQVGTPLWIPTQKDIDDVEESAASGLTIKQIVTVLGIGESTFYEKKANDYPELQEAFKRGKTKGIADVVNVLHEKAISGDNTAIIFFLTNRDRENWQNTQKREHTGKDGGPIQTETQKVIRVTAKKTDDPKPKD